MHVKDSLSVITFSLFCLDLSWLCELSGGIVSACVEVA